MSQLRDEISSCLLERVASNQMHVVWLLLFHINFPFLSGFILQIPPVLCSYIQFVIPRFFSLVQIFTCIWPHPPQLFLFVLWIHQSIKHTLIYNYFWPHLLRKLARVRFKMCLTEVRPLWWLGGVCVFFLSLLIILIIIKFLFISQYDNLIWEQYSHLSHSLKSHFHSCSSVLLLSCSLGLNQHHSLSIGQVFMLCSSKAQKHEHYG